MNSNNLNTDNLIEVSGLSQVYPSWCETFKHIHIKKMLYLAEIQPDIEKLLRTSVSVEIINSKIISSSKGISQENQTLTGFQIIIEGSIIQNIEYISNTIYHPVQVAKFDIPFSTFVTIEKSFIYDSKFKVVPYIEDVYINQISKRKLFSSSMITLNII